MKKIVAVILAMMLALSMFSALSFAAESSAEESGSDDTTFRAYSYDLNGGHSPSIWFNTFDSDGDCTGTDYVIFNGAAPLKGIGLPELYAGKSANKTDANVRFELFAWDTDAGKTIKGTPVFTEDVYFDGDSKTLPCFTFESALPAGQYLFRITQLSGIDDDGNQPYSVLPTGDVLYSETKMEFDSRGTFVFYVDFEKTDSITDYFLNLEGKGNEIEVLPEKTVFARDGATPHPIVEYGIVTPVIPDGQVLYSLTLTEAPTWTNKNGDSDIEYAVYKWTGDYEESAEGTVIASGEILDHADNSNLTLKFDTALRYGNSYLIVIIRSNNGAIGYYQGRYVPDDQWTFFEYGIQLEYCPAMKVAYANVGDLGPEPTEVPTEAPTEVPATNAPTDNAEPTTAPTESQKPEDKATKAPSGSDKSGGPSVGLIIGIIAGVVVIAAAVIIILVNKKKSKA